MPMARKNDGVMGTFIKELYNSFLDLRIKIWDLKSEIWDVWCEMWDIKTIFLFSILPKTFHRIIQNNITFEIQ